MKRLTLITALTPLSLAVMAQTKVKQDADGNYIITKRIDTTANKATGKTITTADGKTYPVMISSRGKLFYLRTAKSGNIYKAYLKED